MFSSICALAVGAAVTIAPLAAMPQRGTVDFFDWKIQQSQAAPVTEQTLDGTIACKIDRTRSVDKEAYPRMTADQQRVALEKAAFDKKRSRHAVSTHCNGSSRVSDKTACDLEMRMKRTRETASGSVVVD